MMSSNLTERLIENVRKCPMLYDVTNPDYKNVVKKAKIWSDMAKELREDPESVKRKWKNLRDSYMKYKNFTRGSTCRAAQKYKKWQWNTHLEFLDSTYTPRPVTSNAALDTSNTAVLSPSQDNGCSENSLSLSDIPPQTKKYKNKEKESGKDVDRILKYLISENEYKMNTQVSYDEVDHLFFSYAKTFKRFSVRRQAKMKLDLANLFTQAELSEIDEQTAWTPPPLRESTSYSDYEPED